MKTTCTHTKKGACDISVSEHCLDCCRVAHGSSGDGSYNWNWKATPKPINDQTLAIWNAAIEAAAQKAEKPDMKYIEPSAWGPARHLAKLTAEAIRTLSRKSTEPIEIRIEHECAHCSGTGLYQGFAEQKDAAAVVCSYCKGTGQCVFEEQFEPFTGRKPKKGVKRVFQTNPGIAIGTAPGCVDPETKKPLTLEHFGGIPHKDWVRGYPFGPGTEMRRYTCPAWWYQSADSTKKPQWKECHEMWGSRFSECKHFKAKNKCWERFDAEQAKKEQEK